MLDRQTEWDTAAAQVARETATPSARRDKKAIASSFQKSRHSIKLATKKFEIEASVNNWKYFSIFLIFSQESNEP